MHLIPENGDVADSHSILNRWKNCFPQLLNVHRVSDIRQIDVHTAEPLVRESGSFEVEIAIPKLKKYNLRGGRSLLLYQFTSRAMKLTVVIIKEYHLARSPEKLSSNLPRLTTYKIIGDQCWFQHNR
jgi:hypothetical protein